MTSETLRGLIADLISIDENRRNQAKATLLREGEAIIPVLIDEFYAGVGVQTGEALLEIIGQIGGYQVTALFLELMETAPHASWRDIAIRWLRHDGIL